MSATQREYDIILWGATGFTGSLTAEKLYKQTNNPNLRWAIAGRNQSKLQDVKHKYNMTGKYPAVLTADINDQSSIDKLVQSTYVVLSTAGPYSLIGEPLVKAAATHGTQYADITAEYPWVAEMIRKYESAAVQSGAKLVPLSGFDSLPADLGSLYAVNELKHRVGTNVDVVSDTGYVSNHAEVTGLGISGGIIAMVGGSIGFSGGTIASLMTLLDEASKYGKEIIDPYVLVPQQQKDQFKSMGNSDTDMMLPAYSYDVNKWTTPFIMAPVNTRVVRRSAALYQQANYPYGSKFHYNEALTVSNALYAYAIAIGLSATVATLLIPPVRSIARKLVVQPGNGPSEKERLGTTAIYTHTATASNGDKLYATFSVQDPGYGNTATFLAQTGLLLLDDAKSNKQSNDFTVDTKKPSGINKPGFLTGSTALGYKLIDRLNSLNCGIKIEVSKVVKSTQTSRM